MLQPVGSLYQEKILEPWLINLKTQTKERVERHCYMGTCIETPTFDPKELINQRSAKAKKQSVPFSRCESFLARQTTKSAYQKQILGNMRLKKDRHNFDRSNVKRYKVW